MMRSVDGCTVSPRKSRRKSPCFSSTTVRTPARASRKPSITPAGPPPAMQHWAVMIPASLATGTSRDPSGALQPSDFGEICDRVLRLLELDVALALGQRERELADGDGA